MSSSTSTNEILNIFLKRPGRFALQGIFYTGFFNEKSTSTLMYFRHIPVGVTQYCRMLRRTNDQILESCLIVPYLIVLVADIKHQTVI